MTPSVRLGMTGNAKERDRGCRIDNRNLEKRGKVQADVELGGFIPVGLEDHETDGTVPLKCLLGIRGDCFSFVQRKFFCGNLPVKESLSLPGFLSLLLFSKFLLKTYFFDGIGSETTFASIPASPYLVLSLLLLFSIIMHLLICELISSLPNLVSLQGKFCCVLYSAEGPAESCAHTGFSVTASAQLLICLQSP